MKKILSFIFIFFLLFGTSSKETRAYQYASNCPDLPKIPAIVDPTSGTNTTQFDVTLQWSQFSDSQFNLYKDIDISVVTEVGGRPTNTHGTDSSFTRKKADSHVILSDFFVPNDNQTAAVHLNVDQYGICKNYEASPITIALQSATGTTTSNGTVISTKKENDTCDPNLQNQPQYTCPARAPCTQISLEWRCLATVDKSAPTVPPTPCPNGTCSTALGDISTSPAGFVRSIFGILLSLAGGIAVILIIVSGYKLMSSQGNPEKVQAAREQLTSAIIGLLFIIFSITILQIIGVDILHLPGLNP